MVAMVATNVKVWFGDHGGVGSYDGFNGYNRVGLAGVCIHGGWMHERM